jgi:hypothetical protein
MWKMKRIGEVIFPQAIQGVKMAFHNRQGGCCSGVRLIVGHARLGKIILPSGSVLTLINCHKTAPPYMLPHFLQMIIL